MLLLLWCCGVGRSSLAWAATCTHTTAVSGEEVGASTDMLRSAQASPYLSIQFFAGSIELMAAQVD